MKCKTQFGRSMVEMLGVLAIIGVLSVGGLAGYSTAMEKIKTNRVRDQIIRITGAIRSLTGGDINSKLESASEYDHIFMGDMLLDIGAISRDEYINNQTLRSAFDWSSNLGFYIHAHETYGGGGGKKLHMEFIYHNLTSQDTCISLISNPVCEILDFATENKSGGTIFISPYKDMTTQNAIEACPKEVWKIWYTCLY